MLFKPHILTASDNTYWQQTVKLWQTVNWIGHVRERHLVNVCEPFFGGHMMTIQGLTTLNKPKSREVSTNDGIITQNIFNAAVPTSIEKK